jgi:hypothetical protein
MLGCGTWRSCDAKKEKISQRRVQLLERLHAHYVDLSTQIAELERDLLVEHAHAGLARRRKKVSLRVARLSIARMAKPESARRVSGA